MPVEKLGFPCNRVVPFITALALAGGLTILACNNQGDSGCLAGDGYLLILFVNNKLLAKSLPERDRDVSFWSGILMGQYPVCTV